MNNQSPMAVAACKNRLLEALPENDWRRICVGLQPVELVLGQVLYESGVALDYVYFPTTAIMSLMYVLADGRSAEFAVVGNFGIVGVAIFMGGGSTPSRAVVQSAGAAYRLKAQSLKDEFTRGGDLQHLLLRYTQALSTQMSQTAVCNRHHSIAQQLCRWMLMRLDCLGSRDLSVTHALIAEMLGVRREGVSEAVAQLQSAGLIRHKRGWISVLDRPGIEARCCECYATVKHERDRLLPRHIGHPVSRPRPQMLGSAMPGTLDTTPPLAASRR